MSAARCVEWSWKYGQDRCPRPVEDGLLCDRHLGYEVHDLVAAHGITKAEARRQVVATPRSPHPFMEAAPVGWL